GPMPQRYDATPMSGRARGAGRSDREDVTTAVVEVLAGRLRPTGSSFIHARLLVARHRVSEPTVGRILRDLDRLGLTTGHGRQGRTRTVRGRRHVEALRHQPRRTR